MGVATDAESRKPVSTQDAAEGLASTLRASAGSAGTTSVWANAKEIAARTSTARISAGCFAVESWGIVFSMDYRQLGRSGLRISALTLGTMTFGGRGAFAKVGDLDPRAAARLLDLSLDAGVNLIDTANVYSEGY